MGKSAFMNVYLHDHLNSKRHSVSNWTTNDRYRDVLHYMVVLLNAAFVRIVFMYVF